ncbi:PTS system, lactose/cellobiose family IIC component [Clostridium thermobutyricum]|uniref:Permease IIC component n=1 Tax=Clostridium thermobutyricum TaxID=29372 RepID=N9XV37_9CLOT|nr:PTS transporter subunit EIIC [Clostridium thermobutyricum]ENY99793.1 PTS system, lactose/cellobiose family IIC component [Clostridium thermobutyricum]
MNNVIAYMEEKIMPKVSKIGNQRHLIAIRDGFLAMIALTMVASIATLINNIPIGPVQNFLKNNAFGQQVSELCQNISWGAFSFMALFACMAIAHSLWTSYENKGFEGGLVAAAVFLAVSKQTVLYTPPGSKDAIEVTGGLAASNFGATALFTGIIIAIVAVELLRYLSNVDWLEIKLPDMVPPAVARSFKTMLPGILTITALVAACLALRAATGQYLPDLITKVIQAPIQSVTDSLATAIFYPLLVCGLWALGLHGTNVTDGIAVPIFTSLSAHNMQLAEQGATTGYNVINGPFFYSFVWLGGAGATLGLLLAILIAGKRARKRYGAITSLSLPPGVFNINEPVIFGLPVVLNPIIAIPFIIIPVVLSVISYFAISSGLVHPVIVQSIPWTTPPIMSGFLATGHLSGAILSGVNLILATVLYLPFINLSIRLEEKQNAALENEA